MKEIKRKVSRFVEECPSCPKVIEGPTENQVRANLEIHRRLKHAPADGVTGGGRREKSQ